MWVRSQTGHANKSLKHVGVMDHRLAGRDGKRDFEILASCLCQVDTGEGSVEVELQSPKVSGLAVVEPGVGLGVAKAELQLEACSVAVDYITGSHGLVRAEVDLPLVHPALNRIPDGNLDEALQTLGIGFQAKQTTIVHMKFDASCRIQIGEVYLPIIPSGMSPLSGGLLRGRIPQGGIVPQAADHMEAFFQQGKDEGVLRKERIRNQAFGYGLQLVLHGNQQLPVPIYQVVVHLLKGLGIGCLKGAERHTIVIVNVNQANPQQFEAPFGTTRRAGLELAKPRRLVSRLRDEARVHRNGTELTRAHLVRKGQVERKPVELVPGEGVTVGLFGEQSVPSHLEEIDLVGYRHEKFQGIDEYFLERFA